jgi:hypothetical protein
MRTLRLIRCSVGRAAGMRKNRAEKVLLSE